MEMMIHSINEEDIQRTIRLMTNKNLLSETLMWMFDYFAQKRENYSVFDFYVLGNSFLVKSNKC